MSKGQQNGMVPGVNGGLDEFSDDGSSPHPHEYEGRYYWHFFCI